MGSSGKDQALFERCDCEPGEKCRIFQMKLLMNSTRSDEYAWSIADTFRRRDQGATDAAGVLVGPAYSINAATRRKEETAHRKRVKDAFAFLILHISNERVEQILSNMTAPYFQEGEVPDSPISRAPAPPFISIHISTHIGPYQIISTNLDISGAKTICSIWSSI